MDQNLCISSLCPKQDIVIDNMTREDYVAQSLGPTEPKGGRSIRVWRLFRIHLQHMLT
jgi:hypothetical protein